MACNQGYKPEQTGFRKIKLGSKGWSLGPEWLGSRRGGLWVPGFRSRDFRVGDAVESGLGSWGGSGIRWWSAVGWRACG